MNSKSDYHSFRTFSTVPQIAIKCPNMFSYDFARNETIKSTAVQYIHIKLTYECNRFKIFNQQRNHLFINQQISSERRASQSI